MLQNEVYHSLSSETRLLRIQSLKNHSLCKSAFLSRNASKLMLRLFFFLIIRTRVCKSHFMWKEHSCELILLAIWRFSRNFLWIVYKNYRIQEIFVFIWDFATSFIEELFQFFLNSFLFYFDRRSNLNILSYAQKIRICFYQFANLHRANVAIFFEHVVCASF
jgi:hypothetical protein